MGIIAIWMGSPWAGGIAVFVVAAMEFSFAAALMRAAAHRLGGRKIARGAAISALMVTVATGLLYALLAAVLDEWRRPAGGAILLLLGLYLAMRFGTSRLAADGGGWDYDGIMPTPRKDRQRGGFALGRSAVGIESIKAAVAWIGVALADDPVVASVALGLAVVTAAIAAMRSHALTVLPPSLLYGIALMVVIAHGLAATTKVLAAALA